MPPKANHQQQQDSDNNNTTTVNINVGILGHVDSGKTSLAKALSRVASTAAFDKNPQSQERGITLDLGFSAFFIDVPSTINASSSNEDDNLVLDEETQQINKFCRESFPSSSSSDSSSTLTLQYTLVDCPGHASLIRAVMGAAHIIDLMILVIDITKGIQTQTAECIVLGEMLGRKLVVVLNKIDLVPGDTEDEKRFTIEKKKKALRNVFARTRWPNAPFVEVSANPGSNSSNNSNTTSTATATATTTPPIGIDNLKNTLKLCAARMARSNSLMSLNKKKLDPTQFFMMVDHCFSVKGHGTVLTGTVVGGTVGVGDDVKIPDLGLSRRVKSMQVFRKPVQVAHCGDRIGLCVTQVNAERLERGIACSNAPNSPVITIHHACICSISKVRFFKGEIESSNMIFHITIGHVTAMATMRFFSLSNRRKKEQEKEKEDAIAAAAAASSSSSSTNQKKSTASQKHSSTNNNKSAFDFAKEYEYEEKITEAAVQQFAMPDDEQHGAKNPEDAVGFLDSDREYFAVVLLDRPVTAVVGSMVIASHLDSSEKTTCRLAMHGQLLSGEIAENMPSSFGTFEKDDKEAWRALRVVKYRERQVNIDKVIDNRTCVARPPKQVIAAQKQKEKELKDHQTVVSNNKKQLHHQQQQIDQQVAAANASATTGGGGGAAAMSQQQQQPVSTKVVFHQPVIELSKFIGFPVIFRKKGGNKNVKGAANNNNTNNNNTKEEKGGDADKDDDNQKKKDNKSKNDKHTDDKKKKNDDDDDNDEVNEKEDEKEEKEDGENGNKTDGKPKKNNKNNSKKTKEKKPKFVDIRGKIDSVVGGATNKVKVVFDEDAFDGPRAFGNVLMLDKKYPFSTAFKVEADL